jgi:hypothetical protein
MSTADPKPKRPRMTKAEREAARAAKLEAEERAKYKPIDPMVWLILGALILFVAAWTWLDPVSLAEAGQPKDQSIFQLIPSFLIMFFGKNSAVLMLTILGTIPFLSGLIGWLRKRFRKAEVSDA